MPTPSQVFLNPNDGLQGGYAQKKRQFQQYNQHYISHNAVLPTYDPNQNLHYSESYTGHKPPQTRLQNKDPYAMPLKPTQMHLGAHDLNNRKILN
jgi:hypothetical protein